MVLSIEKQLEQYTIQHPEEVLLITARVEDELDEIMIFRGFSSSLVRATSFDPDIPVLPDDAEIVEIARLVGPYTPDCPQYLERHISWHIFSQRLSN